MTDHQVVSHQEWQAARDELLQREKEHTRMGDELARQRRELPWVTIEKEYRFDTDDGTGDSTLYFDADGTGGGAATKIATFNNGEIIGATDFDLR